MAFLRLVEVRKAFGPFQAVRGVSLEVQQGELLTLLGPSGCGKTTTLRMIAGLEEPDAGEIVLEDRVLFSAAPRMTVSPEDRNIGMVFQSYAVWPHMSVFENVAYPLEVKRRPQREIRNRVEHVLSLVGLLTLRNKSAALLSGGEQQRVALARALVANPRLLLFDEPLSNLDAQMREYMRVELRRMLTRLGITAIYVTHDQAEAMVLSDRVAVMNRGLIEQVADPRALYEHPATRFVAEFLGAANFIEGVVEDAAEWPLVRVRTGDALGGVLLQCRLHSMVEAGQTVLLVVRPERIRIGGEPMRDGNVLRGRVTEIYYLGERFDCRVRTQESTLRVHTPRDPGVTVGTEIDIVVPQDAFVLVRP